MERRNPTLTVVIMYVILRCMWTGAAGEQANTTVLNALLYIRKTTSSVQWLSLTKEWVCIL